MDVSANTTTPSPVRHDGWTGELKVRFLDHLSEKGNVRASCRRVGMSAQAAYRLKRRDPLFARSWDAALVLGRTASEEVLADRAIDGIEEDVWHRGELVGTRRRYDTRLLLAHLGRLDRHSVGLRARGDAERFDELLALVAGEEVPEGLAKRGELLPSGREEVVARASDAMLDALARDGDEDGEGLTEEEWEEWFALGEAESKRARQDAEQRWDAWFARACEVVDRAAACPDVPPAPGLPGSPLPPAARDAARVGESGEAGEVGEAGNGGAAFSSPCTVSLVSTSALARAMATPRPLARVG